MSTQVLFYRDLSPESEEVEAGLKARMIDYEAILDDSSEALRPAIIVGHLIYETLPSIQFYFFNDLDKGYTIGGVRKRCVNAGAA